MFPRFPSSFLPVCQVPLLQPAGLAALCAVKHTGGERHRLETQLQGLSPPLSSGAGSAHAHLLHETALITGPC